MRNPWYANRHMAIIYKAKIPDGRVYIGCTTKDLSRRKSEHKFQSYRRYNEFQKWVHDNGMESVEFSILENVEDAIRFEREQYWIKKFKTDGICLNNSDGGQGPNGFKAKPHQIALSGEMMKARWESDRESMLKRVNSHKTTEFQKMAGILGGHGKAAKQPFFTVVCRKTNKIIGRFQTKREFGKTIGVTESTAGRYLSGKLKIGNELYKFIWE